MNPSTVFQRSYGCNATNYRINHLKIIDDDQPLLEQHSKIKHDSNSQSSFSQMLSTINACHLVLATSCSRQSGMLHLTVNVIEFSVQIFSLLTNFCLSRFESYSWMLFLASGMPGQLLREYFLQSYSFSSLLG